MDELQGNLFLLNYLLLYMPKNILLILASRPPFNADKLRNQRASSGASDLIFRTPSSILKISISTARNLVGFAQYDRKKST